MNLIMQLISIRHGSFSYPIQFQWNGWHCSFESVAWVLLQVPVFFRKFPEKSASSSPYSPEKFFARARRVDIGSAEGPSKFLSKSRLQFSIDKKRPWPIIFDISEKRSKSCVRPIYDIINPNLYRLLCPCFLGSSLESGLMSMPQKYSQVMLRAEIC